MESGKKVFQMKDSNYGQESTIPEDRTTFQEEFSPQNQKFKTETPHIAAGYILHFKKN